MYPIAQLLNAALETPQDCRPLPDSERLPRPTSSKARRSSAS